MDPEYEEFKHRLVVSQADRMYSLLIYIKWHHLDELAVQRMDHLFEDVQGVLDVYPPDPLQED